MDECPTQESELSIVLSVVAFSTATVQLLGWEQQWMLTVNEQGDSSSSMLNSLSEEGLASGISKYNWTILW